MGNLRRTGAALAGCALIMTIGATGRPAFAATSGQVRVDQGGYAPAETKTAYLMAGAAVGGERFAVLDAAGRTVLTGPVGATSRGAWNAAYPDVYPIDLSALRRTGSYRVRVSGKVTATSPSFTVRSADALYGQLVRDGVTFYQTQRDGRNVIRGALDRKPAHLNDAHASVYATPTFVTDDIIAEGDLTRLGGAPVNVAGGWFDAGDYLKFTHTTAYGAIDLLAAQRALGKSAPAALGAEARHGIDWLDKMWDQRTKTLYLQVGIGSGNQAGTFLGDHDLWRLPEQDDADKDPADRYAAAHRPVFEAAAPGKLISPNLAGRVAAAFAMAAQEDPPARARAELRAATSLFARADVKSPPNPLVTALPNAFYPEATWHDDMELAGAEIALADRRLHQPGGDNYIRLAAGYAKGYISRETGDTFNLYDVSALAHTDLIQAMGGSGGYPISRNQLVADLKRQVQTGAHRSGSGAKVEMDDAPRGGVSSADRCWAAARHAACGPPRRAAARRAAAGRRVGWISSGFGSASVRGGWPAATGGAGASRAARGRGRRPGG